jgi:hypothetical protein
VVILHSPEVAGWFLEIPPRRLHFFQRGEMTEQKLRTLHGVVKELGVGRRRGRLEPETVEE